MFLVVFNYNNLNNDP